MTWGGRVRLGEKLSEYERYATEIQESGPGITSNAQKQKMKKMEAELHALLDSTY